MATPSTASPRRKRQPALHEHTSYGTVARNALGLGFLGALGIWVASPLNLRTHFSGGRLTNDFLFMIPVIVAAIAIEFEHCRRWGLLRAPARWLVAVFFGAIWVLLAVLGYLAGQQPALLVLDVLGGAGQPIAYSARMTVAAIAVALSLLGAALVWTLRVWISERRRMRGPQVFAEVAEIFAAVLGVLNRIVHLFTGLVYVAGGILVLLGLKLGSGFVGDTATAYVPPWMQTVAALAGVVSACFLLAKGFQRLLRAASLKPGAIAGPHGSAYTATASDLRRAGILQ